MVGSTSYSGAKSQQQRLTKYLHSNQNPSSQYNTLTKIPHCHKMLTNGSFATLRETPSGSDCGSTQLTTSTLDESHSSDNSTECYDNYYTQSGGVRRSNTSATLARGSSNTGYFSVKDYGAATLGRMPRVSERVRQGVIERLYWDRVVMPAVSETRINFTWMNKLLVIVY